MKTLISNSACLMLALACVNPALAEDLKGQTSLAAAEGQSKASSPNTDQSRADEFVYRASTGDSAKVLTLLQAGVSINAIDSSGTTALMAASSNGMKDTVKLLIDKGADLNIRRKTDGWSALTLASFFGFDNVVRLLLDGGADVNEKNNYGETALFHATSRGQEGCVQLLLAHGADVTPKNDKGYDALRVAQSRMYIGIAKAIEQAMDKTATKAK